MNKKVKQVAILSLALIMFILPMTACKKDKNAETDSSSVVSDNSTLTSDTSTIESTTETTSNPLISPDSPFALNPLTGVQNMEPDNEGMCSCGIVVNNHILANPSKGTSRADVIYEYETEGGQTRMLALFADISSVPEIGSLRSARIIASDLCAGTNSIFIHFGKNARVPDHLVQYGIDHVDGNNYDAGINSSTDGQIELGSGLFFWRDRTWRSERDLEHTAVTNGTQLLRAIEFLNISREGETTQIFNFVPFGQSTTVGAEACTDINVYFSANNDDAHFVYDEAKKVYYKSQYSDSPQIDETTGEQLCFTNVFVLFANIQPHGDTTIDAYLEQGGDGYYVTNGQLIHITWTKASPNDPILVFDTDGNEVNVNAGKSFIGIVRNTESAKTTWS